VIKNFFATIPDYPFQAGSSLSVANVGYATLQQKEALKRLKEMESIMLRQ
jgi:arylsulfatase